MSSVGPGRPGRPADTQAPSPRRRNAVIDPEQPEQSQPQSGQPGQAGQTGASDAADPALAPSAPADADRTSRADAAHTRHGRRGHRSSRAHLRGAVRESPARAQPHDSTSWLPLPDVAGLPEPTGLIATSAGTPEARSAPPAHDLAVPPAPPSPARARPHDAAAWFPLPVPDELPSIDEMLTQQSWEAKPSPARAEPHDATAWLPLPDLDALPAGDATGPPSPAAPAAPATRPAPRARRFRARTALVALLVLATVGVVGVGLQRVADAGTSVEIRADGRRISLDTGVATVASLLRSQQIRLGEFDRVVPRGNVALRDGLTVTVLRAFPITRDLDGDITTVYTTYASPSDYVRREVDGSGPLAVRSAPRRLQAQSTIILRTPHSGRLVVDGATVDFSVPALDVDELLAQYSVELGPEDYVVGAGGAIVGRDTRLVDGTEYLVVRVGRELERIEEPYSVPDQRVPDATMNVGETRVEAGAPGIMSITSEVIRRNNEEIERKVVSRVPTVVARPTLIHYGTKADPMWDRIAQCETGGNWGMQGPLYSGGLGFYNGTWDAFGGRNFAPNAGLATREEQILVAEHIRSSVGIGGWGCAHTLGYVR